jgi:hypothetical protein
MKSELLHTAFQNFLLTQSPKAQDLNFALLGLLCTSHFDSNKRRPGGNDRAKSRIQLVNGFSDVLK